MNPRIYLTVTLTAVLITALVGADNNTTNANVTTPTVTDSTVATGNAGPTAVKAGQSTTSKAATVQTTTPKPITCSTGTCNANETCINSTGFTGTTKTCAAGESCAVNETKGNTTNTYDVSCLSATACQTITKAGTGACCNTNNCKPDLKAAQAKARGGGGGGGGSDYLRINVNAFVCVAFIALKNIYGYV
ncbi:uncharacterized protein LOC132714047 [Ruditapes philippinarum]|uniref:uncharacterized protein LOC132714047 n=1 Tax=Ruditapes philippinarum TaxID=129788 RepID=UPI00295AB1AC|nr:uncharacterized protein LOC132714047 [Ruditapes philippinarum]